MKNNLESAWYNKDILPNEMKMRINGKKSWPKLENSWHFQYLDEAIKVCGKIETLIDLGCGGAEVGRVYPHIKYVGYETPAGMGTVGGDIARHDQARRYDNPPIEGDV